MSVRVSVQRNDTTNNMEIAGYRTLKFARSVLFEIYRNVYSKSFSLSMCVCDSCDFSDFILHSAEIDIVGLALAPH